MTSVTVIGGGIMGSGIAQLASTRGHDVVLCDVDEAALVRSRARIDHSLERFERKGTLSSDEVKATRARIEGSIDVTAAVAEAKIVIEAVPEQFDLKADVWAVIGANAPSPSLLATNTSQISITRLAAVVPEAAGRFVGMHFFNPPVMMRLVEIVRGVQTSEETVQSAIKFTTGLERTPVVCQKDSPGFVTTRAYAALRLECLRMLDEGLATAEDIDTSLKLAFNFPMGPLELADFNGLDTVLAAYEALAEAHGDRFRPTTTLRNTVAAGHLGHKTGQGFYRHSES